MASRGVQVDWLDPEKVQISFRPEARFAPHLGPWVVSYDGRTMAAFEGDVLAEDYVRGAGERVMAEVDFALQDGWRVERMPRAEASGGEGFFYQVVNLDGQVLSQHTTEQEGRDHMDLLDGARFDWNGYLGAGAVPGGPSGG